VGRLETDTLFDHAPPHHRDGLHQRFIFYEHCEISAAVTTLPFNGDLSDVRLSTGKWIIDLFLALLQVNPIYSIRR
jgi:hypothetical protein